MQTNTTSLLTHLLTYNVRLVDGRRRSLWWEMTVCRRCVWLQWSTTPSPAHSNHCMHASRSTSRSTREPGRPELTAGPPSAAIRPQAAQDIPTTVGIITRLFIIGRLGTYRVVQYSSLDVSPIVGGIQQCRDRSVRLPVCSMPPAQKFSILGLCAWEH